MNNNEPIVLGKIKKGKTGKPLVVLIVFIFIGILILFLPTISNYFGDNNILDLIKNGEVVDFFINHDNYVDKKQNKTTTKRIEENTSKLINKKTILEYNNFNLSNFNITTKDISFKINTSNNINFDESNYYLILEKDNKKINTIKLIGEVNKSYDYNFTFINELNDTLEIKGYITILKDKDYPEFTLSSDETGTSSLFCEKDKNKYEYMFNNNLLYKVKEEFTYSDNGNSNEYFEYFEKFTNLSNEINNYGGISSVMETYSGFKFNTEIDLNTYNKSINNNYYSFNTTSKKINFEMKAKGYDCK